MVYPSVYSLNSSLFEPNAFAVSGGICGTTVVDSSVPDLWHADAYGQLLAENVCYYCHTSNSFARYWE